MSEELLHKLDQVKRKVHKLRQMNSAVQEQNTLLQSRIEKLEQMVQEQKNTISKLEESNKIVKLAKAITLSKADIQQHKQLLNRYIRDIDKCIRLLSD